MTLLLISYFEFIQFFSNVTVKISKEEVYPVDTGKDG